MSNAEKDVARLLSQYQFEIRDLSIQLDKQQARLKRVEALLESYEKNEVIYHIMISNMTCS